MLKSNEVLNGNYPSSRRYSSSHNGIDFPCPEGTLVLARFNGILKKNGTNPPGKDFGNYCLVEYDDMPLQGWYAHLSRFNLGSNAKVLKGEVIGFSGNTGDVIGVNGGYHLHYSESTKGTLNWVNPDLTTGGEETMPADQVAALFRDMFGREPTDDEIKQRTGRVFWDVFVTDQRTVEYGQRQTRINSALSGDDAKKLAEIKNIVGG